MEILKNADLIAEQMRMTPISHIQNQQIKGFPPALVDKGITNTDELPDGWFAKVYETSPPDSIRLC